MFSSGGNTFYTPRRQTNIGLWLTTRRSSITKDGSDLVSQWDDISGLGLDVTQGTGSLQPVWVDNILKTGAVIRFAGGVGGEYLNNGSLVLGQNVTAFFVFQNKTQLATGSIWNPFFSGAAGAAGDPYITAATVNYSMGIRRSGSDGWQCYPPHVQVADQGAVSSTATDGSYYVHESVNFNGSTKVYKSGSEIASNTSSSRASGFGTGYDVGGQSNLGGSDRYYDGDLAEIVIFKRVLNSSQRTEVRNYLNSLWGTS